MLEIISLMNTPSNDKKRLAEQKRQQTSNTRRARIARGLCPQCPLERINPMRDGGKTCLDCLLDKKYSATRKILKTALTKDAELPDDIATLVTTLAKKLSNTAAAKPDKR